MAKGSSNGVETRAKPRVLSASTVRPPPWTYLEIRLQSSQAMKSEDGSTLSEIGIRQHLSAALVQFYGITGASIAIDILRVENRTAWIRIPTEDATVLLEALNAWSHPSLGWSVVKSGSWLAGLTGIKSQDLFDK